MCPNTQKQRQDAKRLAAVRSVRALLLIIFFASCLGSKLLLLMCLGSVGAMPPASKSSNAAAHLDAIHAYLNSLRGSSCFEAALHEQLEHVKRLVLGDSITSLPDAAEFSAKLKTLPFDSAKVDEVVSQLHAKLSASMLTVKQVSFKCPSRISQQDYTNLPNYFTKTKWQSLPALKDAQRLEEILAFAIGSLGLRHPSEMTSAVITTLTVGDPIRGYTPAQQHACYKSCLPTIKDRCKAAADEMDLPYMLELPLQPALIDKGWINKAYSSGEKWSLCSDLLHIKHIAQQMPLRSSNKKSRDNGTPQPLQQSLLGQQLPQQILVQMMAAMMQPSSGHAELPLLMLGAKQQQQQQQRHGFMRTVHDQLAIEDEKPQRASQPVERAAGQVGQSLQVPEVSLPEGREAPAVNDGESLPADRAIDRLLGSMDAREKTKRKSRKARNGKGKRKAKAGAEALQPGAQAAVEQEQPATPVRKRQAVDPPSQGKIKEKQVREKPPAKIIAKLKDKNVPSADKLKIHERWGCSKCRWKPGCSNSCANYRSY